ncbi:MAG: OmpA family protein [Ferrovum myxofaciens]|uniref:flagellar motor protein MotB n=1 Tax=Ferrovum myxofaciens TaxID=416213 RepID=UPI002357F23B|nr:flagellar motor protein MotB [Ferrovum myxofaciens]QKE41113.1 MAG: OmpA family protein [Ferrovum myxofaciens]
MARHSRRAERDHSDHRWLVSYSDFITLLFAFFVVMYAISAVNESKYARFHSAINSAFKESVRQGSSGGLVIEQDSVIKSLIDERNSRFVELQRRQQDSIRAMLHQLDSVLAPLVKQGMVRVLQTGRGIVIDLNAQVLFQEGDADLQANAYPPLDEVAKVLNTTGLAVEVKGHTDNIPISIARYPSNWELSTARASGVVRFFINDGVVSQRLTAAGDAENDPLVPNDSPEDRARNRRVTVTVLTPTLKPVEQSNYWEK